MKKILLSFARTGEHCPENIPMSPARRTKLEGMNNAEARAQHIASSAALHALLGDRALTFRYGENGRPLAEGGYVSPAHTRGMAACAFCDVPVGCDIEPGDRRFTDAMKKRFGTLDQWLALEACVKMTGEGLTGIRKYRRCGGRMLDEKGEGIAYVKLLDHGEYRVAVCCGEDFEIEII